MYKIGLTGGIGSGKTIVATLFQKLGVPILDADEITRELMQPGYPAYNNILTHFGSNILAADKQLNRRLLRKIIFANSTEKTWLENVLHPLVREILLQRSQQYIDTAPYIILVIPLLLESKNYTWLDRICVVDIPTELQRQRAALRDQQTAAEIDAIINAQIQRPDRLSAADDIIDNKGSLVDTEKQIMALHKKYLELAKSFTRKT